MNEHIIAEQQTKILSQQAVNGQKIQAMEEKVNAIYSFIIGNGKPGALVRLDRVEQRHKTVAKLIWAIVFAVIGVAATTVWSK